MRNPYLWSPFQNETYGIGNTKNVLLQPALVLLAPGGPVHQIVDALLSMMIRKINRGTQSVTPTTSGSSNSSGSALDDAVIKLKVPTWDILEATLFVLDAALTACAHGRLSPRELATGRNANLYLFAATAYSNRTHIQSLK